MTLSDSLDAVYADLRAARGRFGEILPEMKALVDRLEQAIDVLEHSFSGSWIGYHGRTFYRDFEVPLRAFAVQWGGLHRQEGWQERPEQEIISIFSINRGTAVSRPTVVLGVSSQ